MNRNHFYSTLVLLGIAAPLAAQEQCLAPLEAFNTETLANEKEIVVKANNVEIQQDTIARFKGKVEISNQSARINAEHAIIDKDAQLLSANENIRYEDKQIQVDSENVTLDLSNNSLKLDSTEYRLRQLSGRGAADTIELNEDAGLKLLDVSFSSCPANAEDWRIQASSIELKPGELWGTAKHTRFYVKDIPIFYLPYFSFPVTELRQTGLLFPNISSSDSTGLSYEQPYYWNILPNLDATISPRLMSKRGVQLKTEVRYLTKHHAGEVNLEYLNNDSDSFTDNTRYFYRLSHQGELSNAWSISADINGLSDDNYIVDLGSDFYNRADTHLFKTFGVSYHSDELYFSARFRDFEIIGDHPSSYRALPEMKLSYELLNSEHLSLNIDSELTYFDNDDADVPKATRLHIAPTLTFPFRTSWAEFLAETSLLQTFYYQDNIDNSPQLDRNAERTLGRVRLYGAMSLERNINWFGDDAIQTLEPKFQYHYTSYQDQNNIGLYDTTRLLNDVVGLFRGQEFTGLDRISDTNQIALGVTSRVLDSNNKEQLSISLGQIFYFDDNQVLEANKEDNRSALAAELDWRISRRWFAQSEVQVSSANQKIERSNISLEYRLSDDKLLQINHRYVRDLSGDKIDQMGLTATWPINGEWHWVGRYYRDLNLHRTTESYAGVQYESCCWAMQLVWQRHLTNRLDILGNQSFNEYDSGINFRFVFKGMGSGSSSRKLLNEGLYGYRRPYFLSN